MGAIAIIYVLVVACVLIYQGIVQAGWKVRDKALVAHHERMWKKWDDTVLDLKWEEELWMKMLEDENTAYFVEQVRPVYESFVDQKDLSKIQISRRKYLRSEMEVYNDPFDRIELYNPHHDDRQEVLCILMSKKGKLPKKTSLFYEYHPAGGKKYRKELIEYTIAQLNKYYKGKHTFELVYYESIHQYRYKIDGELVPWLIPFDSQIEEFEKTRKY